MDEENIVIKNIRVEYITTKTDNYNYELRYFKIKDKSIEQKNKPFIKEQYKLPWFKTDKGQNILKVKQKYIKLKELTKDKEMVIDMSFKYYEINDIQGYYVSLVS